MPLVFSGRLRTANGSPWLSFFLSEGFERWPTMTAPDLYISAAFHWFSSMALKCSHVNATLARLMDNVAGTEIPLERLT